MAVLTVYDCEDFRTSHNEEFSRFKRSADLVGDAVAIVCVKSAEDIPPGEARDSFNERSFACLPLTDFDGVVVVEGDYPADQEIVDYVDVPDGVLDAKRDGFKPANELEFSCSCCRR